MLTIFFTGKKIQSQTNPVVIDIFYKQVRHIHWKPLCTQRRKQHLNRYVKADDIDLTEQSHKVKRMARPNEKRGKKHKQRNIQENNP